MLREVRLDIIITTRTRIKWNLSRGRLVSISTSYLGGLGFKSRPWGGVSWFIFRVFCRSWQIRHQHLEWDHYGFLRHLFTVPLLILTECFIFWVALRGMNVHSAYRLMSRRSRIAITWHLCARAACFRRHEGEEVLDRRTEGATVPAAESSRFRKYIFLVFYLNTVFIILFNASSDYLYGCTVHFELLIDCLLPTNALDVNFI
jgi:hypothetical protein